MSQLIDNLNAIYNEKQTKIKPENIKKGVQIFDILGTHENLDTTDATATAGDIAKDKTAYVNGEKITGTYTPEEIVFDENSKIAYTRLQYIESTGTQYINTGYKPNSNTGYEFEYTNFIDDGCLFGAYASNWANGSGLFTSGIEGPDVYYWFHYNGNWNTMIPSVFTKDATVKITKNNIIINETSSYNATSSSFSVNYPVYLFGGNIGGSLSSPVCVRVKKFVISENDVIKHNFIPVRSNINGEVGLFDEIGQKFYTNQGTGTFIAGPEVLEEDYSDFFENYQQVEYIESTGKQYINTGVKPTTGVHSAWVDFQCTKVVASKESWIFGQWYGFSSTSMGNGWRCGGSGSSDGTTLNLDSARGFTYNGTNGFERIQGYSSASTITAPYEMALFGQREESSVRYYDSSYYKLFGCKIWENGVLIRNFIPCYKKSNNQAGLYDLVNKKFYTSGTSYSFNKGQDVTNDESAYILNGLTHYFKLDGNLTEEIYDTKCIDCGVMFVPDITLMRSCCDTSNGYAIFDTVDLSRTTFTLSVLAKTYSTCTDVNHMLVSIGGPNSSNDVETTADTACALKIANKALSVDFCHSALGSSINPVGDGKWHRYTITYDGQAIRLFDNTTQVAGQAKTLKININALGIIGNWLPSWDMHYKGVLANLLIYNRVLSETEIAHNCTQDGI
jgi:hypothetical protein